MIILAQFFLLLLIPFPSPLNILLALMELSIGSLPARSLLWLHKSLTQGISPCCALKVLPASPGIGVLTPGLISSPTFCLGSWTSLSWPPETMFARYPALIGQPKPTPSWSPCALSAGGVARADTIPASLYRRCPSTSLSVNWRELSLSGQVTRMTSGSFPVGWTVWKPAWTNWKDRAQNCGRRQLLSGKPRWAWDFLFQVFSGGLPQNASVVQTCDRMDGKIGLYTEGNYLGLVSSFHMASEARLLFVGEKFLFQENLDDPCFMIQII